MSRTKLGPPNYFGQGLKNPQDDAESMLHRWMGPTIISAMDRDDLLKEIEKFIERHGIGAATFGRYAMNDSAFVSRLRAGHDVKTQTVRHILQKMAEYEPKSRPRCRSEMTV